MLSTLPTELLRLVVEFSIPRPLPYPFLAEHYSEPHYSTRQGTLQSLSLVSHQLRAIAQPLLLSIVRIRTRQQLDSLSLNHPRKERTYDGSHTRCVDVTYAHEKLSRFTPSQRNVFTSVFSSVATLTLDAECLPGLDLSDLNSLSRDDSSRISPGSLLQSHAERILVDTRSFGFPFFMETHPYTRHVRFVDSYLNFDTRDPRTLLTGLMRCADWLKREPAPPIRSVYLDSTLGPDQLFYSPVRAIVDHFATACEARDIDIVFEQIPQSYFSDSHVSPEFVRRRRMRNENRIE
ncbi:hypothetical protein JCM11491_002484 [Sporobolomyces phaffii]